MEGRAGKNRNIFLVWLVWPLITLGIYFFVWYYKVNREARDFDSRIEVDPAVALLAVLLGWIIIVPPFISIYRTGERIARMQRAAGLEPSCSAIIGLLQTSLPLESLYPERAEPDLGPLRQSTGRNPGSARRTGHALTASRLARPPARAGRCRGHRKSGDWPKAHAESKAALDGLAKTPSSGPQSHRPGT